MNLLQEIFPGRLQNRMRILEKYMPDIQEIRIRVNSPIIIWMKGREYSISHDGKMCGMLEQGIWMNTKDLEECVLQICRSSIYAYEEETRRGYVKQAKEYAEDCKIVLRNIRQDANNDIKKLVY